MTEMIKSRCTPEHAQWVRDQNFRSTLRFVWGIAHTLFEVRRENPHYGVLNALQDLKLIAKKLKKGVRYNGQEHELDAAYLAHDTFEEFWDEYQRDAKAQEVIQRESVEALRRMFSGEPEPPKTPS
jgi:hypothetical protein